MTHSCHPSTQEGEIERSCQLGLQSETKAISKKEKKDINKKIQI